MSQAARIYRFKQRAEMYAAWDRQLCEKTRFFAAASITNRLLSAVARMRFPVRLSQSAGDILESLGESLEHDNGRLAERVTVERRCGSLLDDWMVQAEQSLVERFLEQAAIAAPATLRGVTEELDQMLNLDSPWSLCEGMLPSVCGYFSVLRRVRSHVNRPIQFARRAHRVRIGQQLIVSIRGGTIAVAE